ncbi:hypothetical protein ACE193_14790 [Bernardetia sp. OM2101]|uniref:hypothetical protein n=1 Tax=Bernardetia sp. OM2101 TaxID=3344876 RepID=UPI0035D07EE6
MVGEFEDYSSLIPLERPFVYWSSLVVHPNYRRRGIRIELDKTRKSTIIEISRCQNNLKMLGEYTIPVSFHKEVQPEIKCNRRII